MDIYDRQGNPISITEWCRLLRDTAYQHVAVTVVGEAVVSTVWLGLDHSFGHGPPMIFETMVFYDSRNEWDDLQERYPTEGAAVAGHDQVVAAVRERVDA